MEFYFCHGKFLTILESHGAFFHHIGLAQSGGRQGSGKLNGTKASPIHYLWGLRLLNLKNKIGGAQRVISERKLSQLYREKTGRQKQRDEGNWKTTIGARQGLFKGLVAETGVRQEEEEAEVVRAPSASVQAQIRDNKECGTRTGHCCSRNQDRPDTWCPCLQQGQAQSCCPGVSVPTFFLLVSSFSENSK